MREDLPEPTGPIIHINSPLCICKSKSDICTESVTFIFLTSSAVESDEVDNLVSSESSLSDKFSYSFITLFFDFGLVSFVSFLGSAFLEGFAFFSSSFFPPHEKLAFSTIIS